MSEQRRSEDEIKRHSEDEQRNANFKEIDASNAALLQDECVTFTSQSGTFLLRRMTLIRRNRLNPQLVNLT